MLKLFNLHAVRHSLHSVFCALMVLAISMSFASCDSDDPENGGDNSSTGIVTDAELVGTWTLVKDNVLYSEVDPRESDEVISYSGNSSPRYKYYEVSLSEDGILSVTEVSASGSTVGDTVDYVLKGNNLITVEGNNVAGTIEHYDSKHAWDNLRIRWNADYSPVKFGAPVISTYML